MIMIAESNGDGDVFHCFDKFMMYGVGDDGDDDDDRWFSRTHIFKHFYPPVNCNGIDYRPTVYEIYSELIKKEGKLCIEFCKE